MSYSIHYGVAADLPALAKVHRQAFPNSLATAMGQQYVERMLSWFLSSDKTFIFYVKTDSGEIAGYCGGMIKDGTLLTGSASGMLQHSFNMAMMSMALRPWLFFHKEMTHRYGFMLSNITRKLLRKPAAAAPQQKTEEKPVGNTASVGLVTIGVKPSFFGKGVGSVLLQEFERKSKELKIPKIYLSVKADNDQAIKAYERNGWKKVRVNDTSLNMDKDI